LDKAEKLDVKKVSDYVLYNFFFVTFNHGEPLAVACWNVDDVCVYLVYVCFDGWLYAWVMRRVCLGYASRFILVCSVLQHSRDDMYEKGHIVHKQNSKTVQHKYGMEKKT
jgi:hypothetical protein